MTKELAVKWITLFHKAFEFYPIRFISPGYLAEKVAINRGFAFPAFNEIPYEIQEFAYRSYFGARFEMLKRGCIGHGWLYDINSAYPDKISKIPDLSDGEWVSGREIESKAKMGFFKIRTNVPEDKYLSPFPFRANHILIFPSGKFITYTTLDELKTCEKKDYYEILESWQFIPNSSYLPYSEDINELYNRRKELKGTPLELPLKLIINSLYGKTGEILRNGRSKQIGNLFNPTIFAHITGSTRAQIYCFIKERDIEKYVVGIATDSIMITRPLNIDSPDLGEFSFKKSGKEVYYLQNGIYRIGGNWSSRGFGKLQGNRIENTESLECEGRLYLKLIVQRNTQLRSAIIQNKISEIGKIKLMIREINLNADRKRLWLGRLTSLNDDLFNESMPLSMNQFAKDDI